ncbi:hypothetical protein [Bacillus sp. CDB3]|uniref:hypothetical protein n=1 Tax=Bacillus sp. CDB3 TaxID=360310 RepID=UPI0009D7E393|nr:hypothetical protein [Bacillus sp. CDB3]OQR57025.1 hypothetical protein CDB3_08910 [Bacillus sp. CDB3]
MNFGLNLSKYEIARIEYDLQTKNNKAYFKYNDQDCYIQIDPYVSFKDSLFNQHDEALDFKEKIIKNIMVHGLGNSHLPTTFAIKKGIKDADNVVTVYTSGSSFPKGLFLNADDFEMITRNHY